MEIKQCFVVLSTPALNREKSFVGASPSQREFARTHVKKSKMSILGVETLFQIVELEKLHWLVARHSGLVNMAT